MAQVQPAVSPIQTRFDGGLISPRLRGRFDSDLYKKALAECDNFEPLPQGSLRMRSGSGKQLLLTTNANEKFAKIHTSTGEDFLIELLDRTINVYDLSTGTAVLDSVTAGIVLANGDFSLANGAGWQALNGITDYTGLAHTAFTLDGNQIGWAMMNGDGATTTGGGILYQKIVMPFAGTVHLQLDLQVNLGGANFMVKISTTDPATWAAGAGNVASGGQAFLYNAIPPGLPVFAGSPIVAPGYHLDLGNIHLNPGTYWISFQVPTTGFICAIDNVLMPVTYDIAQNTIPSPWAQADVESVKYATESGRDRTVFVADGNYPPWYLLYGGTPGNWSFGNVSFVAPADATPSGDGTYPRGWGYAGSRNVPAGFIWRGVTGSLAANNFPTAVEFNDGRMHYGGEPAQRNRMLSSRSGSSDDFTIGVNPGDALDFKLATKGAIRWLLAHTKLLAGTDLGYNAVTGSKGTPLVGDISAPSQSGNPCASIQATLADSTVIYSSADLRRVRAVSFDFQTQGFESKDVTFVAEHVTKNLIKEIHHALTPDLMLIVLLKDGTLALCSYEPREQVIAWWKLALTGGTIRTAAVQQSTLGAYLWMKVQRGGTNYLEKLNLSESDQDTYLDSWVAADADPAGAVAGLAHLDGSTVRVVEQGGGFLGDFPVAGGIAQTGADNASKSVYVGLPYLARAVTLPRDVRAGKSQSPVLGVILNNSALPKLNGKRAPDRTPSTPMGTVEPRVTGKRKSGNLGWSDEDTVTIEQDLPFRTEICALYSMTQTEQGF